MGFIGRTKLGIMWKISEESLNLYSRDPSGPFVGPEYKRTDIFFFDLGREQIL